MKNILIILALLAGLSVEAKAQVANISTTAASSFNGFNFNTAMQSAVSNTYFTNDGSTLFFVRNPGTAVTATVVTQATTMSQAGYGQVTLSNLVVPIPASGTVAIGPFPQGRWNTQFGTVYVSFTSVVGVSASAISVAQ